MFWVQAQDVLSALQNIAQQQLEKIALSLAAVAENEAAEIGLIVVALVKVDEDITAELIAPDVEAMGVGLAGVVERIEVGDRAGGQNALELSPEHVPSTGADAEEALLLTEQEPVHIELAPYQFRQHVGLEQLQFIIFVGNEFDIHRAVEERLAVAVHGRYQRGHVLQIAFRGDRLLKVVGIGACHAVFVGRVVDDRLFLTRHDLPGVDTERHPVLFAQMPQDRLLVRSGGIFPQRPYTPIGVAAEEVIHIEFDDPRRDHVEELLDLRFLRRGRAFFTVFTQLGYLLILIRRG